LLCGETDIISEIRKGRLRWLGYVERMTEEANVKKVFKNIPDGKNPIGKPRKRSMDNVKNYVNKISVTACRKVTMGRNASKLILKKAKVLRGTYSQWRCDENKMLIFHSEQHKYLDLVF
jgi:hypothetical protein